MRIQEVLACRNQIIVLQTTLFSIYRPLPSFLLVLEIRVEILTTVGLATKLLKLVQYRVKSLHFDHIFHASPHQTSIYHYFQITMSRQSLGEISGNSNYRDGTEDRFELTPHWHSHIVGRAATGQSPKGIATTLNIPPVIIQSTIS